VKYPVNLLNLKNKDMNNEQILLHKKKSTPYPQRILQEIRDEVSEKDHPDDLNSILIRESEKYIRVATDYYRLSNILNAANKVHLFSSPGERCNFRGLRERYFPIY